MAEHFVKDDFFRDLITVLRKHKCTYLDVKSSWIDSVRFEFDYCSEDEQECLSVRRVLPAIEIEDCKSFFK